MTRLYTRERLQKVERLRGEIREAVEDASEDDLRPILLRAQAQLDDPRLLGDAVLHHAMDQAVLRAYGWDDLAEAAEPIFLDEENEDEFAYQGRLFRPSDFRDDVLARLLALNAERHADEVRRGVAPRQGGRGRATGSEPEDEEEDAA